MERLAALGEFTPPTLRELEMALDSCVGWGGTVVTADLWDVERLSACPECRESRTERLRRLNVTGIAERSIVCARCDR